MDSLILNGISKRYQLGKRKIFSPFHLASSKKRPPKEIWALKDITFSVEKGTVLGIIGRNGAGKTTLLKILARITAPTSGSAIVRGRVVSLLEMGLGFQADLTARENIFLNAAIYEIDRKDVEKHFDEIVSFAGIEKFVETPLKYYSSGMYLRLAFSAAVNMRPDILLADEILAVGDIGFQEACLKKLAEVGKSGVTILFVSHDMATIQRLCNRCICIDEGKIIKTGSTPEVVNQYHNVVSSSGSVQRTGNYRNDYAELISVRLLSEGMEEKGAVRSDESFFIEIDFDTFMVGTEMSLEFVVSFYVNDMVAFKTVPEAPLVVSENGRYSARIKVPANLLAELEYSIKVGVIIRRQQEETILVWEDALQFRVYSSKQELYNSVSEHYRLAGVIRPLLKWELIKQ